MANLVECIPNVSEGRNMEIIQRLSQTIASVAGVKLLHTDVGHDANRTVFTFVGNVDQVIEAAYKLIKQATLLIDMSKHQGSHPRIGAVDVCPFVAISEISEQDLISKVDELAQKLGTELGIPIFMYEKSAKHAERKLLANIRKGQYEDLPKKLFKDSWTPDFGARKYNPQFGAMAMGVRNYLIAYNVNVECKDIQIVKNIAAQIREDGNFVIDENSLSRLKGIRAIGWKVDEYNCYQVSTNITDFKSTGLHQVFETIKTLAKHLGCSTMGSELIGLIPQAALIDAGLFYAQNNSASKPELMETAVERLGLNSLSPFILKERVLELLLNIYN